MDRKDYIMLVAFAFIIANLDEVNRAFSAADDDSDVESIRVRGDIIPALTEEEVTALYMELPGFVS